MLNDIEEHVKDLYDNLTTQNCDSICRSLISDINLKCGEVISQQTIGNIRNFKLNLDFALNLLFLLSFLFICVFH